MVAVQGGRDLKVRKGPHNITIAIRLHIAPLLILGVTWVDDPQHRWPNFRHHHLIPEVVVGSDAASAHSSAIQAMLKERVAPTNVTGTTKSPANQPLLCYRQHGLRGIMMAASGAPTLVLLLPSAHAC
jgi:hypothetical protein